MLSNALPVGFLYNNYKYYIPGTGTVRDGTVQLYDTVPYGTAIYRTLVPAVDVCIRVYIPRPRGSPIRRRRACRPFLRNLWVASGKWM